MPNAKSSEFGGDPGLVQPLPHIPTASEKLSLLYRTGDSDGTKSPDGGLAFSGLIPASTLLAQRTAEGVMEKGQIWQQMLDDAAAEQQALADEVPDA